MIIRLCAGKGEGVGGAVVVIVVVGTWVTKESEQFHVGIDECNRFFLLFFFFCVCSYAAVRC